MVYIRRYANRSGTRECETHYLEDNSGVMDEIEQIIRQSMAGDTLLSIGQLALRRDPCGSE